MAQHWSKDTLERWMHRLVWIGLAFAIAIFVFLAVENRLCGPSFDFELLARVGDYLAGTTGVAWGLAGIILLYITFHQQGEDTNKILRQQKDDTISILKQQQEDSERLEKQQSLDRFNSIFFSLLDRQRALSKDFKIQESGQWIDRSAEEVAKSIFYHYRDVYTSGALEDRIRNAHNYILLLAPHIKTYCRSLYRTTEFAKRQQRVGVLSKDFDDKSYIDLLQAQLSQGELVLLFYNSFSYLDAADLYLNYNIFGSLPINEMVNLDMRRLLELLVGDYRNNLRDKKGSLI